MKQGKFTFGSENFVGGGGHNSLFEEIISLPNIFCAWREFQKDKRNRDDVKEFSVDAEESMFTLHYDLTCGRYRHGPYEAFWVCDPKRRLIHKACVRDRLLHHAIFRVLYPIFNKKWIYDSYSSREFKGTHAAMKRFRDFAWKISRNNTRDVWILKIDVKKYFHSIDHDILVSLLIKALPNEEERLLDLLKDNVKSFSTSPNKSIPLGNLTSQLFANVYLNPFDQYVKRKLKLFYYIRYADDIIVISDSCEFLANLLPVFAIFLEQRLKLSIHPDKISISMWNKGIDVLGFISYPTKTVMRPSTEQRMIKRLEYQSNSADFDEQLNALYSRVKFERE